MCDRISVNTVKFHLKVQEKLNHKKIRKAECVRSREQCNGPKPENHRPTFRLKKQKQMFAPIFEGQVSNKKTISNQNKGHLGSRYIIILYIYIILYILLLEILPCDFNDSWAPFGSLGKTALIQIPPNRLTNYDPKLPGWVGSRPPARDAEDARPTKYCCEAIICSAKWEKYETIWNNIRSVCKTTGAQEVGGLIPMVCVYKTCRGSLWFIAIFPSKHYPWNDHDTISLNCMRNNKMYVTIVVMNATVSIYIWIILHKCMSCSCLYAKGTAKESKLHQITTYTMRKAFLPHVISFDSIRGFNLNTSQELYLNTSYY